MTNISSIALVAHDNKKEQLIKWAKKHKDILSKYTLYATGTTGSLLKQNVHLDIKCFKSGPLGGDQQIGSKIVCEKINALIFFWDPLEPQPHDPDVKALLRIAVLYNIPLASNIATAECIIEALKKQNQ